jgi:flagellar biosynthesis protein FlhB
MARKEKIKNKHLFYLQKSLLQAITLLNVMGTFLSSSHGDIIKESGQCKIEPLTSVLENIFYLTVSIIFITNASKNYMY